MKTYTIYFPRMFSEVYRVEAVSPEDAVKQVKEGLVHPDVEMITGYENLGIRIVFDQVEKPRPFICRYCKSMIDDQKTPHDVLRDRFGDPVAHVSCDNYQKAIA